MITNWSIGAIEKKFFCNWSQIWSISAIKKKQFCHWSPIEVLDPIQNFSVS
jgi:hypothetical protein